MLSQGITALVLLCGWILWLRDEPRPYMAAWNIVEAFDNRAQCSRRLEEVRDRDGKFTLPVISAYKPVGPRPNICLPSGQRPD